MLFIIIIKKLRLTIVLKTDRLYRINKGDFGTFVPFKRFTLEGERKKLAAPQINDF